MGLDISLSHVEWVIKTCAEAQAQHSLLDDCSKYIKTVGLISEVYNHIPHIGTLGYQSKNTLTPTTLQDTEWMRHCIEHYKNTPNPIQEYCMKMGKAFYTKDLLSLQAMQSSEAQNCLKIIIKQFGHGIVVPVFGTYRSRGMFYFSCEDQDNRPTECDLFLLQQICFYCHIRYSELCTIPVRKVSLTKREKEVLQLLPLGYSNRKIGESLEISQSTVNDYVSNIFRKLDAPDRLTATLRAFTLDLI